MTKTSEEIWDLVLNVNLKGIFLCTKAALQHMMRQKSGYIVNISSISGKRAVERTPPAYCASKFGVIGLTQALTQQLKNHGISVTAVCPAGVDTKILDYPRFEKGERDKDREKGILVPEDIAEVVIFLVTRPQNVTIPEIVVVPRSEI